MPKPSVKPSITVSSTPPIWVDTVSGSTWVSGGTIAPAEKTTAAVEAETPGIGAVRKLLAEERRCLDGDDAELVRLREQLGRVRARRKVTVERVEVLEKELELLEAYARMREKGEGDV
jgi:hypothetical protein